MKRLVRLLIPILLALLVLGYFALKPGGHKTNAPGIPITAAMLYQIYQENETTANDQFLGQILEVSGVISDISTNLDGEMVVSLHTNDPATHVICTFIEPVDDIQVEQHIVAKGYCAGILMDVMLTDCVLLSAN